ncbi:MAG: hypothetical protein WCI61_11295, partial [Chloroflexota bacterium]
MERLFALGAAIRRNVNVSIAVILTVGCFVLAFATGFWLLFRLAYITAFALPLLYFWTKAMAESLDVEVQRTTQRVTRPSIGWPCVTVRSRSILPKVWLEVEDPSSVPGHNSKRVLTLGSRGVVSWDYRTRTRVRGLYTLGP